MSFRSICFALWALTAQLCLAAPLPKLEVGLIKRSEAGPQIGGANFPDPSIIQVNGVWYAFATRTIGSSLHIQIATSPDFNTWTLVRNSDGSQKDALPNLPSWVNAASPNTWAPDLIQICHDSSEHRPTLCWCATSNSITGPFTPVGNGALICPTSQGGAIDAAGYWEAATGQRYITYKVDGNSQGHGGACGNNVAPYVATPIILQPVAKDGYTLQGSPTTILNNNGAADQGIVEAPSLTKVGSTYILFFSSGCFTTGSYTVSYATSTSITGPFTRASSPLFATGTDGLNTPGSADIFRDGKHMLFHANSASGRALYTAQITVNGNTVSA
ncbi:hypothetical protein LTR78_006501 [Recurvomyces mirabilis]|uniref:Glycoside hydrolase family 43 protein n=1 Tax=Recurvomyces mirabilis TaxID=574656 RepID=A0AAE1BZT9_9PEZI|nr:hypothetical protein LTR78_006501 [Recurvomyces mirabilis]KAK5151081.1 hypothetical protein LTS14_009576 [Recurvomyces mirabilis]